MFRDNAVRHHARPRLGTVLIVQPLGVRIYSALAVVAVSVLVAGLFLISWPRRASVEGIIVPTEGLVSLSAPADSIIEELLRREGDIVDAGEIILRYRASSVSTSQSWRPAEDLARLRQNDRQRIEGRLASIASLRRERQASSTRQRDAKRQQLATAQRELDAARDALSMREALYKDVAKLGAENAIGKHDVQRASADLADRQQMFRKIEGDRDALAAELAGLDVEYERAETEFQAEMSRLEDQLAVVDRETIASGHDGSNVIRSPVAGTITMLIASVGQQNLADRPIISILPHGSALRAELHIPAAALSYARVGVPVVVKYDAYPYLLFGTGTARLSAVSGAAVPGSSLSSSLPPADYFFRGYATLATPPAGSPGAFRLSPGMHFSAELVESRLPLYRFVFSPLYRALAPAPETDV